MTIEELYAQNCKKPEKHADIWEHLPTLRAYAERVYHVTEFGVRSGNSTSGFLMGLSRSKGYHVGYDINPQEFIPPQIEGVESKFIQADTGSLNWMRGTELLFVDSCHDTEHVLKELRFAHPFVSKYILMHDTSSVWEGGDRVVRARDIFLSETPAWFLANHWDNCNGLSVLERK